MAVRNRAADNESTFPFWVKRWRAYLDVTQKRFAELWGVSASMVQKIEANDYDVGQLSFDRLESLRTLLDMEPALFYGILSQEKVDQAGTSGTHDIKVLGTDLKTEVGTIALPDALTGGQDAESLRAVKLTRTTFASDRLRHAAPPGSLVVFTKTASPLPTDIVLGRKELDGQPHLLLFGYPEKAARFLRPLDPHDSRAVELYDLSELDEVLGVYTGHWTALNLS